MSSNLTQQMAPDYRDIDGKAVASTMLSKVAQDVIGLKSLDWAPRLVSIRIGDHPAVNLYIRNCLLYTSPSPRDS